jgi:hypothetical protein
MSAWLAPLAGAARRGVAATGPWPAARLARAIAAMLLATALVWWAGGASGRGGSLLALPAVTGVGLLAVALLRGPTHLMGTAFVLLGVPAAVAAARSPVTHAASAGAVLVLVLELSRWSVERRVGMPSAGSTERSRWLHLAGVVAGGWLVGVGVVGLASGRIALSGWQAALGAVAAVAIAAAVVTAARRRT